MSRSEIRMGPGQELEFLNNSFSLGNAIRMISELVQALY